MNRLIKTERRTSPRIAQQLPINVVANGYDFATSTKNISCVGAYCHIAKYVPPFTRVNIRLNLPIADFRNRKGISVVECRGVIVRSEDETTGGFNVAIFFNGITDSCRKKISQYISQFIS